MIIVKIKLITLIYTLVKIKLSNEYSYFKKVICKNKSVNVFFNLNFQFKLTQNDRATFFNTENKNYQRRMGRR